MHRSLHLSVHASSKYHVLVQVTVQAQPRPQQYRAYKTLREEIKYYDAQRRARWAEATLAAEDTTTTSSTSEAEAETESSGEEACCSSLVDMPHQMATRCDEDRQGEGKPMGTPLWEPIVREDCTRFRPILEFFARRGLLFIFFLVLARITFVFGLFCALLRI